jgi:hypothetical protein
MTHYDIIGDIHGHAAVLETLLKKLGYSNQQQQGYYQHPERKTIFVGDLIDRGTENFRTLEMAKAMVDNNQAFIVMGNHEFNALCYHTQDAEGHYLRPHTSKNTSQHQEVLEEIRERGEAIWKTYLEWFRRMPLFLEMNGFRVVHACWDHRSIDFIRNTHVRDKEGRLTNEFLQQAAREGTETFDAVDILLKGKEIRLPQNHPGLYDKDHNLRKKVRVKWWLTEEQRKTVKTYDQVTRIDKKQLEKLKNIKIPLEILNELKEDGSPEDSIPVFIGHYWFTGTPQLLTGTTASLDYSVARGGHLVCYRWDGEQILDESKFVRV